jgi:phosphotransferase system HPr (HPr) family protein
MTNYSFEVLIPEGLHARPCAKIIEILRPFEPVHITFGQTTLKILSMLELLLLKIPTGSTVTISTSESLPSKVTEKLQNVFSDL